MSGISRFAKSSNTLSAPCIHDDAYAFDGEYLGDHADLGAGFDVRRKDSHVRVLFVPGCEARIGIGILAGS